MDDLLISFLFAVSAIQWKLCLDNDSDNDDDEENNSNNDNNNNDYYQKEVIFRNIWLQETAIRNYLKS